MPATYFISDVHLGEEEDGRTSRFLGFLKELETRATRIFFVGDIFDFWYEYKYVIPKKHFSVLNQMARLHEKNIEMHYLPGNHDFWLGDFFLNELGVKTYDNEWQGKIGDKNFYLYHGDGVARKDGGYRILKKILRNKTNRRLFRMLHPDWGIPLARLVSGSSRHYTGGIRLNDHEDYIDFARQRFAEGFDYVIMGHRHNPLVHNEPAGTYINLGDWISHFSYGVYRDGEMKLQFLNKK